MTLAKDNGIPLAESLDGLSINDRPRSEGQRGVEDERTPILGPRTALESTLYPKILKFSDFLYTVNALQDGPFKDVTIPLIGSVKLHGTHADIVYASSSSDDFRLQSRNREALVPGSDDNLGFASYISSVGPKRILALRDRLLARYKELNPQASIDGNIILAGEWCGRGVQKKVAISQLPRFFAIVSLNINGRWVEEWEYADICDEDARIYHVGKIGFFKHDLKMNDVKASELEIKRLVDEVERECPFAKVLGAATGQGEGIVWKAAEHCCDPAFWFKSKGDMLAVSNSSKLPPSAVDQENRERIENFAKAIVTEVRLEQGWELLSQTEVPGIGVFLKWIIEDCLTEEKREIEDLEIPKGKLRSAISAIAKPWFWDQLESRR